MAKTLAEIQSELDGAYKAQEEFWDRHPEDNLTSTERDEIKKINTTIQELDSMAADLKDLGALREQAEKRKKERQRPVEATGSGVYPGAQVGDEDRREALKLRDMAKTIGQRFVEAKEFQDWLTALKGAGGQINDTIKVGQSPVVKFEGEEAVGKALVTGTSATSAGSMVRRDYWNLVQFPFRPLTIRDIITNGTTNSDLIEYPRVTGYTNNAAAVAEATATSGGSGVKPESAFAMEKVTTAVKTIAHWIPITRRALADAGQVRTLIDNFLEYGLEEELEDQIVTGDGTGENLLGLTNVSGLTTQAYVTSLLTTTRKARTKSMVTARARPTAWLMSPNDWEAFDLLTDNETRYYFGGPLVLGSPRLWGLPVVESQAMPDGYAYLGDFRQIILWDREETNIRVSDSHSDFFIRNLLAILAELRAALGFQRPGAITQVDLTP